METNNFALGSGCGAVGSAVAYETRDPQFESRHWRNFIYELYNIKDKNNEKEAVNSPSLKKYFAKLNLIDVSRKHYFDSQETNVETK